MKSYVLSEEGAATRAAMLSSSEPRKCPHGFHHPSYKHSCDGCWCEGERDRRDYGWAHDTSPRPE